MKKKIISFVARGSGSGKTHIIEFLIAEFKNRGLKVATVKHSSHAPDFDKPGKDTYRYRQSGADKVMMFSPHGMFIYDSTDKNAAEIEDLAGSGVDIVLMEGFKDGPFPKIEVYNSEVNPVPLSVEEPGRFIAIISDADIKADIPKFSFSEVEKIADFIIACLSEERADTVVKMLNHNGGSQCL